VENSIKHGFKNLKRKGLLRISFEKENGFIRCEVEDNGIGRSGEKNMDGKSHALSITTERLIILNHSLQLPCTMEVTDILNNGEMAGLKTVFRFPENITQ
jgi:LytS/YehU family sensor histidine kinase